MTKTVGVVSLGCDKNRVDTETMLYYLTKGGMSLVDDYTKAQIIIINTCAFIESARKEAIDTILSAANLKTDSCEKLIVTGCLPQKYSGDLIGELTEVDAFLGTSDYSQICTIIQKLYDGNFAVKTCINGLDNADNSHRILTTPAHLAYLKIADGCDNHCTFCTIPSIRGKYRSRSQESLVEEARGLVTNGVKELILVAQDVTGYGRDLFGKPSLIPLVRALSELNLEWIRLMYCYPELVTDELIQEIDSNPKLAKYIDIPIQHADDGILKLMNRRSNCESLCELFKKLECTKNKIAIRTTVMVGFPSETDSQFHSLYRFLQEYKPLHIGVFAYSKELDTPSAKIRGHLDIRTKRERVNKIGELHLKQCKEANQKMIGQTVRVLYEDIDYDRNLFKGRTQYSAPDIDTFVYFKADFADVGNFYDVRITDTDNYDLIGEAN